jgi:uncharacterized protein (UPF0264 family)
MSHTQTRAAPAFLASVKNASEAYEAFAAGADVIDCKDPSGGALGRLDLDEIARVVQGVSALAPVSATIGDTFAAPADAVRSAQDVAATGVAIVKCGFFGLPGDAALAEALGAADLGRAKLFAVLMADRVTDFSLVPHLARAGFIGVMLDTAGKHRGSLRDIMDVDRLAAFLSAVRAHQLAAGLAGSLRLDDIAPLAALGPDILGFRGALCADGRTGQLDEARVVAIRRALDAAHISQQRSVA